MILSMPSERSVLCNITKLFCYLSGIPLVYELDANLKPIKHYYLADEATVAAAISRVANQGKKQN